MDFSQSIYKNKIILIINNTKIDDNLANKIIEMTKKYQIIGLDMKNVNSINSKKFVITLLDDKLKLFNLQNEVLAYISIILKEGSLKSYMNKNDFINNKRELIKRRFLIA